ncbi:GL20212 [Drosophila persimilis]|uniref:GL20212 n=1 Tax=Drosophila persimilis TaxID=7234 RepID=B4GXS7_DROPE|nr:GL20212 [Drosophila persimilis]
MNVLEQTHHSGSHTSPSRWCTPTPCWTSSSRRLRQHQRPAAATGWAAGSNARWAMLASIHPQLPPILSLFAGDQTRSLQAAAANRLYARRSTIVGTMSPSGTSRPILEPPPSYTERASGQNPIQNQGAASTTAALASSTGKFRRRFSVRPTALQIPPGQAPPPGASLIEQATGTGTSPSQSALQRRLSLRPSPLARELSPTSPPGGGATGTTAADEASATRLLPLPAGTRPSTSSTHSPLSRIVQISQAQRKSSMPTAGPGAGSGPGGEK